jgi:ferredoxin
MVTDDRRRVATTSNPGEHLRLFVRIDQDKCTGDGLCVQFAPELFEFDIDGLAYVKNDAGELRTAPGSTVPVPPRLVNAAVDAADDCPGDCIYVRHADGRVEAGPAD